MPSLVDYCNSSESDSEEDNSSDRSSESEELSDDDKKPTWHDAIFGVGNDFADEGIECHEMVESESDDEVLSFPILRSQSRRRAYHNNTPHTTRDIFRNLLRDAEPEADLVLLYPPSLWEDNSIYTENSSEKSLSDIFTSLPFRDDYRELRLNNFCVYHGLENKRYPGQYESLHTVSSEMDKKEFLLDGLVEHNRKNIAIQSVRITEVSIGGLELDTHSCKGQFWVQVEGLTSQTDWLRLCSPEPRYLTHWLNFCWLANFAKYCIDYLWLSQERKEKVVLQDFRSKFLEVITALHGHDPMYRSWQELVLHHDMRRHMVQFGHFVYDLCHQQPLASCIERHPLWHDIGCFTSTNFDDGQQTVVTKNVADTFMPTYPQWGSTQFDLLQQISCNEQVNAYRQHRMRSLGLTQKFKDLQEDTFRIVNGAEISRVEWTLREARDRNIATTVQPKELLNKLVVVRNFHGDKAYFDYALVTGLANDNRHVRIVWLTMPSQTICISPKPRVPYDTGDKPKARYPIGNELFFSDDCNCNAVRIADVVSVHDIAVLNDYDDTPCEFFAIIQYCEKEECFTRITKDQIMHTCKDLCTRTSGEYSQSRYSTRRRQNNSNPPDCKTAGHRRVNCKKASNDTMNSDRPQNAKMSNLSLFSGCGLLDRALEASGKLQTNLSIDCNPFAICSAKANGDTSGEFVVGSVNDELRDLMTGVRKYPVVDCLSAGCPCPGFSIINTKRASKKSQRDCTLLASTLSWIEVVLPGYVVIENVPNMDFGSPSACSQAISFLVALGYQVRKTHLKSTDFGGCTMRERLFILAAAPAYQLPDSPVPTHGNAECLEAYSTVKAAISDLADIHNDTLVNVQIPYHIPLDRLVPNVTTDGPNLRDIVRRIPVSPPGQGLATSFPFLNESQRQWAQSLDPRKKGPRSQTMRRVDPHGYFRTIVTTASWRCIHTGQIIHCDQHRLISLEEAARAQGMPQDFVLVGSRAQKLRQVGNAVPWCLRAAIGREIAKAYQASGHVYMIPIEVPSSVEDSQDQRQMHGQGICDNDDDNYDDIVFITKEEFELGQSKRLMERTPHQQATEGSIRLKDNSATCHDFKAQVTHADTKRKPEAETIEKDTVKKTSLRATPRGTIELKTEIRESIRIRKRTRSRSIVLVSGDEDDELRERYANKEAKQESMEAEIHELGGSMEGSSD